MSLQIRALESLNSHVADGVQTVWNFSFPYIAASHVKAIVVSSTGVTSTPAFTVAGSQMTIASPVANGSELTIYRQTPAAALVDFVDLAALTEANLDLANKQALYLATEAKDWSQFQSEYSNAAAAALSYQNMQALLAAAVPVVMNVRLEVSGSSLILNRVNGNVITIDGVPRVMTAAPTLGISGITTNTQNVYAYWTGTAVALECSATGRAQHATLQYPTKAGDASRTFVGFARHDGTAFLSTATKRLVISYYNRRALHMASATQAVAGINNIMSDRTAANKLEFLAFSDEASLVGIQGFCSDSGAATRITTTIWLDGGSASPVFGSFIPAANQDSAFGQHVPMLVGEGYHTVSIAAATSGTATGTLTGQTVATIQG